MRALLRIVLFIVFLEIFLRIGGLVSVFVQNYQSQVDLKDTQAYRIMCIGESTTFAGGRDSYPSQLERILNDRYKDRKFEVINRGIPGSNSADIAASLKKNLELYKPDMIIAMVGINDTPKTVIYKDRWTDRLTVGIGEIRVLRVGRFLWSHIRQESLRLVGLAPKSGATTEEELAAKIRLHPKESAAYIELGQYLFEQRKYQDAEELFKRAVKTNPKKDWSYEQLAKTFLLRDRYSEAEAVFAQSLAKNPKKAWAYALLSRFYQSRQRAKEAEHVLLKGMEQNPGDVEIHVELASLYRQQQQFAKAEQTLQKAISLDAKQSKSYVQLGFCYAEQKRYAQAEAMFEKAADLDREVLVEQGFSGPRAYSAHVFLDLSDWYLKHAEVDRAQVLLKRVLEQHPGNVLIMRGLANIYDQRGMKEASAQYRRQAEELSQQQPLPATIQNYRKIVQIVQAQGAVMVSMSYAMRDAAPLQKMLEGFNGVVFIDNGGFFQTVAANGKYDQYFTDSFAGDFGHCTPQGARVLAGHVVQSIEISLK